MDDFEIEPRREYVGSVTKALESFTEQVERIAEDVRRTFQTVANVYVCIQGEGNFRKTVQPKYVQYKAQRVEERPTCFAALKEKIKKHYKNACLVIDDEETDDFVVRACYSGAVVAHKDKDIVANSVGWLYNWDKQEVGVWYNSDEMRWKKFLEQVIAGDKADNIPGIETLDDSLYAKYSIRKSSGVAEKTAAALLQGVLTEREGWFRVIEAYSVTHPDDWKERLQENAFFLWMCRYKGQRFELATYLQGFGINLGETR
jgi:uncharacterized protein (UPF0335 family)